MTSAALVRSPSPRLARDSTLTFRPRAPIDGERLMEQHRAYLDALEMHGFAVFELPPLPDHPDGAFTEDLGVAFPEVMVWGRAAAPGRLGELEATLHGAEALLKGVLEGRDPGTRQVRAIQSPGTLDGGDVIRLGRTVLVGGSTRTNPAALNQLIDALGPHGYRVQLVPVRGALHLRTACSPVGPDALLVNPEWVDVDSLSRYRLLRVHETEPFGANVLPARGSTVLVSLSAPRTSEVLAAIGADPAPVDISEFEKAEGGLTCLSLRVPPPAAP